ncbi:MAG: type II secretion system protein M [Deltaproteobacteria bacterium]|nr:type II secretion system protein M [Deltaproteobacteria bacterium]
MERIQHLAAPLVTWFQALSNRERRMVTFAAAAVVLFSLFLASSSFSASARAARRRTEDKLTKLAEVQRLAGTFKEGEAAREAAERSLRGADLKIMSYLEDKGTRAGLDIPALNPKGDLPVGDGTIIESAVELTLTDVPLDKLLAFLESVEAGPGVVRVKYLRLEPRAAEKKITAWTTIAAYRLR